MPGWIAMEGGMLAVEVRRMGRGISQLLSLILAALRVLVAAFTMALTFAEAVVYGFEAGTRR